MPVSDIARPNVVTVPLETSLSAVARTMNERSVGCVVVVDDEEPVGLVSDRDLALVILDEETDPETLTVDALLTQEFVTVTADTGIYDVIELLSQRGLRRVPVVDGDELVGIVSLSDVIVLLGMEFQHVVNAIRTTAPAYEHPASDVYEY